MKEWTDCVLLILASSCIIVMSRISIALSFFGYFFSHSSSRKLLSVLSVVLSWIHLVLHDTISLIVRSFFLPSLRSFSCNPKLDDICLSKKSWQSSLCRKRNVSWQLEEKAVVVEKGDWMTLLYIGVIAWTVDGFHCGMILM